MSDKVSAPVLRPADAAGIAAAAERLRAGGIVAVPSETVYGLAARADSAAAVAAIYRAKGRPDFNPLIVHVADAVMAEAVARFDSRARALAARFWPGPLTLVVPLRPGAPIAAAVCAGLPHVALRCPAHPALRALIAATGVPLAAPSANRSGAVSPTTAAHVAASLGDRVPLVLDGGAAPAGIESTIVALRDFAGVRRWELLRPGPIGADAIADVLGEPAAPGSAPGAIEAPGQLASHYAPGKPVRLAALAAEPDEFWIGFGTCPGDVTLSARGDPVEAAARLYDCLHRAAADPRPRIAVAPIPEAGIGAAINDRLRRAAA